MCSYCLGLMGILLTVTSKTKCRDASLRFSWSTVLLMTALSASVKPVCWSEMEAFVRDYLQYLCSWREGWHVYECKIYTYSWVSANAHMPLWMQVFCAPGIPAQTLLTKGRKKIKIKGSRNIGGVPLLSASSYRFIFLCDVILFLFLFCYTCSVYWVR